MKTTKYATRHAAKRPRRNPPSTPDVIDVLLRARAVASLVERVYDIGHDLPGEMEYGSHDEVVRLHAEADQILEAAERVVREITMILGR